MHPQKENILYGRKPILEALEAGKKLEKIYLQQGISKDFFKEVYHLAKENNITLQQVPSSKLNKICKQNHQGAVAYAALINYYEMADIYSHTMDKGEMPLFIMVDGVTDVRNLGAIARSAACTGVHALILPAKGNAIINADAIKSSAGALNQLPVCKVNSFTKAIAELQSYGIQIVASALKREALPINEVDLTIPTCIVMGSEEKGIPREHLQLVDQISFIPIIGDFDSYNVSVAAGMILYEAMMQRKKV